MPIKYFSSDNIPQSLWLIHPQQQQPPLMDPSPLKSSSDRRRSGSNTSPNFNLNQLEGDDDEFDNSLDDDEEERESDRKPISTKLLAQQQFRTNPLQNQNQNQFNVVEVLKEAMFEKPLTPSDVGKLNRLVIPKQHAEKHFPLSGLGGGGDSVSGGLLLSFEDESGKSWRFRYSYWNSSQSYVLTKGWSRFVKEKRLDAGDVVLFLRHRVDADRLFIGWRRRGAAAGSGGGGGVGGNSGSGGGGISGWDQRVYYSAHAYPVHPQPHGPCLPYQSHDCLHAGAGGQNQTMSSSSGGNSKTLRLFGVNMECHQQQPPPPDESEPFTPDGSSTSSHRGHGQPHHFHYSNLPQPSTHMAQDTNFLRGVNQMRYHQG